jgi:hypothetical protein
MYTKLLIFLFSLSIEFSSGDGYGIERFQPLLDRSCGRSNRDVYQTFMLLSYVYLQHMLRELSWPIHLLDTPIILGFTKPFPSHVIRNIAFLFTGGKCSLSFSPIRALTPSILQKILVVWVKNRDTN